MAKLSSTNCPKLFVAKSIQSNTFYRYGEDLEMIALIESGLPGSGVIALCFVLKMSENKKDIKVVIARGIHLFPFRTEKLSPVTPMVLLN